MRCTESSFARLCSQRSFSQASRNVALTINTEAPILSGLNVQSVRISSSVSIVDGDESIFVVRNTRFRSLCFRAFLRSL